LYAKVVWDMTRWITYHCNCDIWRRWSNISVR